MVRKSAKFASRLPCAVKVLILGLLISQVIATIQVYRSNLHLHRSLTAIVNAGYLAIPNQQVMPSLLKIGTAVYGGIFFTLTVGAGLAILSFALAWIWGRLCSRTKVSLTVILLLWLGCLVLVNLPSFSPLVTAYFLVIPPVVFVASLRWMAGRTTIRRLWFREVLHFLPIAILALLWTSQMDSRLFVDLRDNLLLSNVLGSKINDFYYDYTLYAAEVFKTLDQKTLKTCELDDLRPGSVRARLERELVNHDYLVVNQNPAPDLRIVENGNTLAFEHGSRRILQTTAEEFLSDPGTVLKEFSLKSDRYAFLRQFTYFSLFIGFPLALYLVLHALFGLASSLFLDTATSHAIATILCFLFGISVLVVFHHTRVPKIEAQEVPMALASQDWRQRVAALRVIDQMGLELEDLQGYRRLLASPRVPERYWLARAMGVSRTSATYQDLLTLVDDPHPNVACMAFYSLGRQGNIRAVSEIVARIQQSDHWYTQWYAYRALRALGWRQTKYH